MIDDLIPYFERELNYLLDSADAFAALHPDAAGRLKITRGAIKDPHVERLIQGVAFLNARLRHKIDDDFSEISDALLQTLHPHLIAPLPSFFIARLAPSLDLARPTVVPAGTVIDAWVDEERTCHYSLAADATILPVRVAAVAMESAPYACPDNPPPGTRGILHLTLEATSNEFDFSKSAIDTLQLYLAGKTRKMHILIEQLGVNLLGIGVACGSDDKNAVVLQPSALRNLGFDPERLVLPQRDTGLRAYAILQEFFAYPQKHLFFELSRLGERTRLPTGKSIDLFFYFDRESPELERALDPRDFELNAAPVINLFRARPEGIPIDQTLTEYRVTPAVAAEHETEVYSITDVTVLLDGVDVPVHPLYAFEHTADPGALFYTVTRRTGFGAGGGDDVFIAVADRSGRLLGRPDATASFNLLAFNRDTPEALPWGGTSPRLEPAEMINNITFEALTPATHTRRPNRRREAFWKLVSQLSLNYLSFSGGTQGAAALREILALYDIEESLDNDSLRRRITSVESGPYVARALVAGHITMCAGTGIDLLVKDERLSGTGSYLLCEMIERFFAASARINSFVRFSVRLEHEAGPWKRWPVRAGGRELL